MKTKTIIVARRFDEGRQLYKYLKDFGRKSETFYIQEADLSQCSNYKGQEEKIEDIRKMIGCISSKTYEVIELTQEEVDKIIEDQKALFCWSYSTYQASYNI